MNVHVIDATIRSNSDDFYSKSSRKDGDIVVSIGAACNGINQAISDVARATKSRSIDALIFYGHGASGIQGVSIGKDGKSASQELAAITLETLDDKLFQASLVALKGKFSASGVIILHGCHTGQGDKGRALIKKLSRLAGVPVKAATTYQIVGRSDLVGNIITASPDGSVSENVYEGLKNFGGLPIFEEAILFGAEVGHALGAW